jgi:hypothetical protein
LGNCSAVYYDRSFSSKPEGFRKDKDQELLGGIANGYHFCNRSFLILVAATFLLAIVYTTLFLKGRNLIVLGIYHGLLGALFFYTIMGRDLFLEVFG